jgi:hypothetical protein
MTQLLRLAALAVLGALVLAAPAQAKIVELGQSTQQATPTCPGKPCLAVARTTGYQAKIGTQRAPFAVPRPGKVVAWSITLSEPTKKQRSYFDETFGGAASAGITVLRPGKKLYAKTVAQSPVRKLSRYFGDTVQFPLDRSLRVRKGDVVALTVPTWAPALAVGFGNDTSWRASRAEDGCDDTETQSAQTRTGTTTRYRCLYRTARLTYSVTMITNPKPRKPAS